MTTIVSVSDFEALPIGSLVRAKLKEFYRTASTDQLVVYRAALADGLAEARRRPTRAKYSATFCESRRQLIAEVLGERGVEALT